MLSIISLIFVICLVAAIPIAFALGVAGGAYIVYWEDLGVELLSRRIFYALNSFPLLAIPLFIVIGYLTDRAGMLPQLVQWLRMLVGWTRGGIAYINILATLLFSGVSGTAVSDVAGLGRIAIKLMRTNGYPHDFSAALTSAAAIMGPIIPPSIAMVIYALAAGKVSIIGLFLAGVIPGVLIAVALFAISWWKTRTMPLKTEPFPAIRPLARATVGVLPLLLLPVIVLGGTVSGIFTVTESAAVGTAYVLFIGFAVTRELRLRDVYDGLVYAAETSAVLGLLMGAGAIIAWILTRNQAAAQLTEMLAGISTDPMIFMLMVVAVLFVLGLFMDATAIIIALTPLLAPVAANFGLNSLHFGLVFVLTVMIGMITPPVGVVLFVTSAVGEIRFEQLSRAIWPFVVAEMIVVLVAIFYPPATTWLPRLVGF